MERKRGGGGGGGREGGEEKGEGRHTLLLLHVGCSLTAGFHQV